MRKINSFNKQNQTLYKLLLELLKEYFYYCLMIGNFFNMHQINEISIYK